MNDFKVGHSIAISGSQYRCGFSDLKSLKVVSPKDEPTYSLGGSLKLPVRKGVW